MKARLRLAASLGLLLAGSAGCRSWEVERKEFVEPFNRFLHRSYPQAVQSHDLESLLRFYGPALASDPGFRARKAALLARFERIDYSDDVIEDLRLLDGEERVGVRLSLRIRGVTPAGGRLSLDLGEELVCAREPGGAGQPGGYRIVEEKAASEAEETRREPLFSEEAEVRGLRFRHQSGGVKDRWGRIQNYAAGAGVAVGDYDDDGFDDVYFVSGVASSLFHNKGDGTFEDVTAATGASKPPAGEGRCAVFGDYDGDGREDIFVGVLDAPNLLLKNGGSGGFRDQAAQAGLRPTLETTGAAFADFDRDGYLDLFIINGGNLLRRDPEPVYNALNAAPKVLYMNNGDGTFTDRTRQAGVGHTGWALTVAVQDYDLDGDDDIFVGNDVGYSVLYRNRGDATFEELAWRSGIVRRGTGMGASWSDLDGDGRPDLFVTGMASNSKWIVDLPSYPAPAPWYVNLFFRGTVKDIVKEMFNGNWLYLQNGAGKFQESAAACGVRNSGWGWGGAPLDYDNDGREDLYVLNGFISGPDPADL
jgi:hypothetical protein